MLHKRKTVFWLSLGIALLWLGISLHFAALWGRGLTDRVPLPYTVAVITGIALVPGYLMCAMTTANLMVRDSASAESKIDAPVTVLICARNEEKNIYRAIRCIAEQTYKGRITILCVDNGSQDGTQAEILRAQRELKDSARKVKMIFCETAGKTYALNAGLQLVETDYFITVDADTFLDYRAVERIMTAIVSNQAACAAGNLLAAKGKTWVQKMQVYDYLLSIAAVKRYQGNLGSTLVAQGAFSAYETAAVKATGGWQESIGEDIVLTYRLLAAGRRSIYVPEAVGYTTVPATLRGLVRQRMRWARGMLEGLRAVAPWKQHSFFAGYFETLCASTIFLDLAYVFGFMAGVVLLFFGLAWFVGWITLLLIPQGILVFLGSYRL